MLEFLFLITLCLVSATFQKVTVQKSDFRVLFSLSDILGYEKRAIEDKIQGELDVSCSHFCARCDTGRKRGTADKLFRMLFTTVEWKNFVNSRSLASLVQLRLSRRVVVTQPRKAPSLSECLHFHAPLPCLNSPPSGTLLSPIESRLPNDIFRLRYQRCAR